MFHRYLCLLPSLLLFASTLHSQPVNYLFLFEEFHVHASILCSNFKDYEIHFLEKENFDAKWPTLQSATFSMPNIPKSSLLFLTFQK